MKRGLEVPYFKTFHYELKENQKKIVDYLDGAGTFNPPSTQATSVRDKKKFKKVFIISSFVSLVNTCFMTLKIK